MADEDSSKCSHYKRGCSFVSPCCGKVYECRVCHDDESDHTIDRFSVKEVICRECNARQPATNLCCQCGVQFAKYFCAVCHMYDNVEKGQFHCNDCGICRIGGAENFYHCGKCGLCIAMKEKDSHICRQGSSNDNCPICMEDIHSSRDPAHIPTCGHLLHMSCYRGLIKTGYKCPICQTSLCDMKNVWAVYDQEVINWEMPQHLKDFKVKVMCRDCHTETKTVFHVVGLKCLQCNSYNTVRCGDEEIPEDAMPVLAQEFMRHLEEQRQLQQEEGSGDSDAQED